MLFRLYVCFYKGLLLLGKQGDGLALGDKRWEPPHPLPVHTLSDAER